MIITPVLPVWLPEGRLVLATWGNTRDERRRLPRARWTSTRTWAGDGWARHNAAAVDVPATLITNGRSDTPVRVGMRQGLHTLLARDEVGRPRLLPLCEPSSYYYRIRTRSEWMPVFVGEPF